MSKEQIEKEAKLLLLEAMPRMMDLTGLMSEFRMTIDQAKAVQQNDADAFTVEELRKHVITSVRFSMRASLNNLKNWVMYRDIFGVDGTTAVSRCREMGIDPDAYTAKGGEL